jgi:hypothetical protein
VIVCWQAGLDIAVQRLTFAGDISPGWPTDGVNVTATIPGLHYSSSLCADGTGGAIVAWTACDQNCSENDVVVHRVLANGTLASGSWTGGHRINATGDQNTPYVVSDGSGGAFVAWSDARGSSGYDPYVLRITQSGEVPACWPQAETEGIARCDAPGSQNVGALLSVPGGGVVLAWTDERDGVASGRDIYAHAAGPCGADVPTDRAAEPLTAGARLQVQPNSPDPFNPSTTISYDLPTATVVQISILDVSGRLVHVLQEPRLMPAGHHRIVWHAEDEGGSSLPSGVYYCRIATTETSATESLVLSK